MNINAERFFALTALLAAPLVSASACVINDSDDGTSSNTNANTDSTNPSTTTPATDSTTEPSTTMPATDSTTDGTVGTGDTTGDDPTSGTTDDPTGDTTAGTTGGVDLGNCCAPDGATAGCEVPEVQDCVCEADPYCCDELWDESCAAEVNSLGCGDCDFPPTQYDCYCIATCDDKAVAGPWQVCAGDSIDAATAGQGACEDDLTMSGCAVFACDECDCSTAEVPEIDCG